ncbi:Lipase GDSL domain-containing protein [Citrus sinensis]|uniref:Lipase GDSL domain-containing protein n=1 Tax=Citrus sinensis TaxID=2711 RepID=A0ACB8IZA6_CITSI|nr:Lipase GDSL domain-containing protein [Citrus sinensis]
MSIAIVAAHIGETAVPAVFIFGDSTMDVGTNNFLPVSQEIKADFYYNGIDYPFSKPTGRFSNGYNTADRIVKLLGYKKSPPSFFALLNDSPTFKRNLLEGVNFASGGSGILNTTGLVYNNFMSLGEQINLFATVLSNITELCGPAAAATLLSKSLFIVSSGSNDILEQQRSRAPLSPDFLDNLQSTYADHLRRLYNLGARKFAIITIPPIGCCPVERSYNGSECLQGANEFARQFYNATETLLQQLSSQLSAMNYSIGNSFGLTLDIMGNPLAFGFKEIRKACCGDATTMCNQTASLCQNRDEYLFWDRFHPTQKTAELAALTFFGGSHRFMKPVNFSTLAAINIV